MDIICRRLHKLTVNYALEDAYEDILAVICPDTPTEQTRTQMSAETLHEVLTVVQLTWPEHNGFKELAGVAMPFIVQAREDARVRETNGLLRQLMASIPTKTAVGIISAETPPAGQPGQPESSTEDCSDASADIYTNFATWYEKNKDSVAKWTTQQNYIVNDNSICAYLSAYGMTGALRDFLSSGRPASTWPEPAYLAAKNGHLETLKLLVASGFPLCAAVLTEAIRNGHLDTVKWLLANNVGLSVGSITAITAGHLDILRWLIEDGHDQPRKEMYAAAVDNGEREIITYLMSIGCPMDADAMFRAVSAGFVNVTIA